VLQESDCRTDAGVHFGLQTEEAGLILAVSVVGDQSIGKISLIA